MQLFHCRLPPALLRVPTPPSHHSSTAFLSAVPCPPKATPTHPAPPRPLSLALPAPLAERRQVLSAPRPLTHLCLCPPAASLLRLSTPTAKPPTCRASTPLPVTCLYHPLHHSTTPHPPYTRSSLTSSFLMLLPDPPPPHTHTYIHTPHRHHLSPANCITSPLLSPKPCPLLSGTITQTNCTTCTTTTTLLAPPQAPLQHTPAARWHRLPCLALACTAPAAAPARLSALWCPVA